MRRADRQTTEDEARALLSSGEYGVLSTVSPAGVPYGVPISYAFHNGEILFHSAPEGQKLDNLIPGSLASFCVVGKTEVIPEKFSTRYQSAIVHGQVRELLGPEKIRALAKTNLLEAHDAEVREARDAEWKTALLKDCKCQACVAFIDRAEALLNSPAPEVRKP